MVCVYVLNDDNPPYFFMTLNSMRMLRHYNRDIPIRVFLIEDSGRTNRDIKMPFFNVTKSQFIKKCKSMGVDVQRRKPIVIPGDEDFFLMQRMCLAECPETSVLHLDSDTLFFGDVAKIFESYGDVDVAACKNTDIPSCVLDGVDLSFNGGVVLWNNGKAKGWCGKLPYYSKAIKDGKYNDCTHKLQQHLQLREEASIALFAMENGLTNKYIDKKHCQLACYDHTSIMVHCITVNFPKFYQNLINQRLTYQPPAMVGKFIS